MKIRYFVLVLICWFIIHSVYIVADGLYDKEENADLAIVLGNKVNEDGSLSRRLKARLDQSILVYKKNRVKKILVSGGYGKEGYWEADEMRKYLIKNEIKRDDIIVDNYGNDTEKTVENTIKITDSLHYSDIITISQYYHQSRIKKLFKKKSLLNVNSSSPKYFEMRDFYSILREFFAFYIE